MDHGSLAFPVSKAVEVVSKRDETAGNHHGNNAHRHGNIDGALVELVEHEGGNGLEAGGVSNSEVTSSREAIAKTMNRMPAIRREAPDR